MATTTVALKAVRGEIPAGRWIVIVVLGLGMVIHYVSRSALAVPLALPDLSDPSICPTPTEAY